ncbi:MAG: V-type proton ATPase subunit E [Clostridiales bacterium]|jgi:vacuolar-type H+-ATPase subunit E/Vma4|nr:V-type proton ATPase subunit E [Clostridiales bacterium]
MNVEKKLDNFMRIAMDEATYQQNKVNADLKAEFETVCGDYKLKAEAAAKDKLIDVYFEAKKQTSREEIRAATQAKRDVIELRGKLQDEIFKNVEQKLREYVKTSQYKVNLLEELKSVCLDVWSAQIILMEDDLKHIKGKIPVGEITFAEADEDFIGGYKLKYNNNAFMDNTYKLKLRDSKRDTNIFKVE